MVEVYHLLGAVCCRDLKWVPDADAGSRHSVGDDWITYPLTVPFLSLASRPCSCVCASVAADASRARSSRLAKPYQALILSNWASLLRGTFFAGFRFPPLSHITRPTHHKHFTNQQRALFMVMHDTGLSISVKRLNVHRGAFFTGASSHI
jgi:hypothetical protein